MMGRCEKPAPVSAERVVEVTVWRSEWVRWTASPFEPCVVRPVAPALARRIAWEAIVAVSRSSVTGSKKQTVGT